MKKLYLLSCMLFVLSNFSFAQESTYQLSSHILDITQGKPAANVKISLSKQDKSGNWSSIDEKFTDENGRIKNFLKEEKGVNNQGIYKLTYYTAPYLKGLGQESFYPFIEVVFELKDSNHYHVPITLSAYGYSTYRGN
ncbi:MAG: hydroxyisourate hydrolase [Bacteroidia bacterium]